MLKKSVRVVIPSALFTQLFRASAPAPSMPRSGPPLAAMAEKTPLTIPPRSWTNPQKLLSVSSARSKYAVRDPSSNPATIFWAHASAISAIFSERAETIGEAAAPAAMIPWKRLPRVSPTRPAILAELSSRTLNASNPLPCVRKSTTPAAAFPRSTATSPIAS